MNHQVYAGSSSWTLPQIDDLATLYADLGLTAGRHKARNGKTSPARSGDCNQAFTGRASAIRAPRTTRLRAISICIRASRRDRR